MLKEYTNIFRRLLILSDYGLMIAAFFIAYAICLHVDGFFVNQEDFFKVYPWFFLPAMVLWGSLLRFFGMYESLRLKRTWEIIGNIFESALYCFIVFSTISYVFKIEDVSRLFVEAFFGVAVGLIVIAKIAIIMLLRRLRAKGLNFRNVLIVGTGPRAQKYIDYLDQQKELGLKVMGLVDEDPEMVGMTVQGYEILGHLAQMPQILREYVIDYAIFIVPRSSLNKIEPALMHCEMVGVTASVAVDLFDLKLARVKEADMLGIPMITFDVAPHDPLALAFKRLFDLVVSTIALIVISPLYLGITVAIKLTSAGPVYFCQERCGLNGRRFKLYKFRTMVVGAESKLKDLLAFNEMSGPVFKMENDPRITKIGKFLRKFSLDELPQLWNVFRGDMSLVGPRPPLPSEVCSYDPWHRRRLSIRPGITCIWQAGGRNRISSFDQWVKMDLEYIDHWSLLLDFKILFKTIPAVLMASGAK